MFGGFSEQLSEFVIPFAVHQCQHAIQRSGPRRPKKKNGEQNKGVCEKKGLRGQTKTPPPSQKGPGRCASEGPCDPVPDKIRQPNPKTGGDQPSARRGAPPCPHSGKGAGRRAPRACRRSSHWLGLLVKRVKPQNKNKTKEEKKTTNKDQKPRNTPAASRPKKKGLGRFKENPKNARGPEWHPEKTPRSGTHGQNGRNNKCGRTTKRRTTNTGACGGGACDYLIFLSWKKKPEKQKRNREKQKRRRRKNQRKRERPQKTPDLTTREFFRTVSGANRQK